MVIKGIAIAFVNDYDYLFLAPKNNQTLTSSMAKVVYKSYKRRLMPLGWGWGVRGLVHPRTSIGGGARRIQVPRSGTKETLGGAGVERSGTESPGHPIPIP